MTNDRRTLFPGILLIGLGLILFLPRVTDLRMHDLWPFIILVTGLAFLAGFFADRSRYGYLMPAGVCTTIGGLFLYCSIDGWWHMRNLWPLFIAAPGIGFLLQYFLGKRERGNLQPALILLGTAAAFLAFFAEGGLILPLLLVLLGVLLLLFHH